MIHAIRIDGVRMGAQSRLPTKKKKEKIATWFLHFSWTSFLSTYFSYSFELHLLPKLEPRLSFDTLDTFAWSRHFRWNHQKVEFRFCFHQFIHPLCFCMRICPLENDVSGAFQSATVSSVDTTCDLSFFSVLWLTLTNERCKWWCGWIDHTLFSFRSIHKYSALLFLPSTRDQPKGTSTMC